MEKKFFLFAGYIYYPMGGVNDLIGTYPTLEEALRATKSKVCQGKDWFQIADERMTLLEMGTIYPLVDPE
jgi:hypothetical protein